MKCNELMKRLEELSPPCYALEWDNSGLLVGGGGKEVQKVLLSVDVTDEVIQEAIENRVDMVIAHHPLIFGKIKRVVAEDMTGRRILKLAQNNICCYCMHTNFDVMGMADEAADMLGLTSKEVLDVTFEDEISKEGIGRYGFLKEHLTLQELAEQVKRIFALDHVTVYGDMGETMVKAAISTGSGKSMIPHAIKADCDVLITGDIDYHSALDAIASGISLIDAGHFGLEKMFIPYIREYLKREVPELTILASAQGEIGKII